jgi:hypothetical protein
VALNRTKGVLRHIRQKPFCNKSMTGTVETPSPNEMFLKPFFGHGVPGITVWYCGMKIRLESSD